VKWDGWVIRMKSYLIEGYLKNDIFSLQNLKNWIEICKFWNKEAKGGLKIFGLWVYDPAEVSTLACNDEMPYLKAYLKLRRRTKKSAMSLTYG